LQSSRKRLAKIMPRNSRRHLYVVLRRGWGTCSRACCGAAWVLSQYERDLLNMRDQAGRQLAPAVNVIIRPDKIRALGCKGGRRHRPPQRSVSPGGGRVGPSSKGSPGNAFLREERRADHEHTHRSGRGVGQNGSSCSA